MPSMREVLKSLPSTSHRQPMPVISALQKSKWEDQKFKVILGHSEFRDSLCFKRPNWRRRKRRRGMKEEEKEGRKRRKRKQ